MPQSKADDIKRIQAHLTEATQVLDQFLKDPKTLGSIQASAELMRDSIKADGKVISCGNGGSLCDAMHFAEELTGRFRDDRPALPAIAIADAAHMSCVSNDYGYDHVFERFVQGMGQPQDTLLAISTSGNSKNVLLAAKAAQSKGMKVVALTGKGGGELALHCDAEVRVPDTPYADRVQEIHIKVIHCLIDLIENM